MRIRRPKLLLPDPLAILALALVGPLWAIVLTTAEAHEDKMAAPGFVQLVEVQAEKLVKKVSTVPAMLRSHLTAEEGPKA